jgi:hypothetical protein
MPGNLRQRISTIGQPGRLRAAFLLRAFVALKAMAVLRAVPAIRWANSAFAPLPTKLKAPLN